MNTVGINTLKVGDKVGYCTYPTYGWNRTFRYPILDIMTVTRITPKRTKIVLNDSMEVDRYNFSRLIIPTEEDIKGSNIAKTFRAIKNLEYKFDIMIRHGDFSIGNLTDEELKKIYNLMSELYSKYKVEDNK